MNTYTHTQQFTNVSRCRPNRPHRSCPIKYSHEAYDCCIFHDVAARVRCSPEKVTYTMTSFQNPARSAAGLAGRGFRRKRCETAAASPCESYGRFIADARAEGQESGRGNEKGDARTWQWDSRIISWVFLVPSSPHTTETTTTSGASPASSRAASMGSERHERERESDPPPFPA